jgi:hypothetical protein
MCGLRYGGPASMGTHQPNTLHRHDNSDMIRVVDIRGKHVCSMTSDASDARVPLVAKAANDVISSEINPSY